MSKLYDNDCKTAMTLAPEGCQRRVDLKKAWRRTAAKERERTGWRGWREVSNHQLTELVGDRVLRPYLPLGAKLGGG